MADVSKALNVVRKLNPMGFFSRATEEAQRLPQAKGTGEQMRAMLLKQGVKPDELKWTGFDDWAKGKKSVTRDEITEFLRRNEVQLGEKRLGGANPYPYTTGDEWQRAINRAERQGNYDEAERLTLAWEAREGVGPGGAAKFEKYTLPGGKDYSELLLTRPTPPAYSVKPTENGNFILIDNATGEPAKTPNGQMVPPFSSERQANDIAQTYSRAIGDEKMRETGYRSSHWDDPNVLAHMRMSGRTDPEGRRVLHLEELQSDWAQEGRKKGFDTPERTQKVAALKEEERRLQNYYNDLQQQKSRLQPTGGFVGEPIEYPEGYNETIARLTQEMRNTQSEISAIRQNMPGTATPNAPFVESTPGWTNLALKRAMIEAARGNYDAIAWTPGAEQAKRFDLSKQIDDIRYAPSTDGRTVSLEAYRGGENIFNHTNMPIAKLDEFVGRDVAERIAKGVGETDPNTGYRVLSGLDLQVGGEGMKGYYDKILPTQIGKVLKDINETPQFGTVNVPTPTRDARYHRLDDAELMAELRQNGDPPQSMTLPSINLTPQMREKINQGLPLFTMMPAAVGLGATASQMQEGQNPAVEEPREGFEFGGPVDMRAGEMIGLRARLGLSPRKINDRAGPIHTDPAVAAARDAAAAEESPAVVEQALDVVRSQPRQPVAARPLTIPAPRSAPPDPSESQRLWQLYNESENPADFVRADEAMRAGRADGGKIVRKALDFLRANPELKPYKGGSFSLKRQGVYNPKFFDLKKDDLIDDAGNIIASKNVTIPREGFSYNLPAQADPDKIFRGMSAEEFANFQKNNYLKSFGTHNIGDAQEGLTYFSVNPDEARSYAHSFAPSEFKPDPSRPAYVMAVKRPPEDRVSRVPGTGESEVGVTGQIPREDVTNVYRGNVVDYIEGIDEPGAKVSPTSSVYWEEIADYAKGGHVERADGGRLLEDQYPSQYLPDVGRQVMQDGGAPNNDAYLDALLAAHSDPNADIRDYQRSMGQIAQQPEDVRSMTHAPSKPMRPIEIEGGFIGKRQLGQAPYDVAGPLSGMAQTAYSLKTLPFYFTPAAPFAAASDFGEAVIDTKSALDKGDYVGAGLTGALGVALPAAAYRKQIGNALSTARDVLGRVPAPYAAGAAGAAAMTPEEAQAANLSKLLRAFSPENSLMMVHNLKSHRLADVEKLGGLPVPSTAIVKPSQGFTDFGDITMVAPKEMAQPSRTNPIFGADIYSPRFPTTNDEGTKIFKGFSPSGTRRYSPLTLENAVKEMKGNIRGGEGFDYGAGTIRAGVAPQFKSIEEIKNARDLIKPREEIQGAFNLANEKLNALAEKYYPHYNYAGDQWVHMRDFSDMLREAGTGKWGELRKTYKSSLPPELYGETTDFLNYLRKLPTEYFEGKPQRAVRLDEFRGAVVPSDIAGEQADILRRMGVERLEQYDPSIPASRIEALQKFGGEQFSEGGSVSHRAMMLAKELGSSPRATV